MSFGCWLHLLSLRTVMEKQRLAHLMNILRSGELSRNKNFDAHQQPDVKHAKMRQLRLDAIAELLSHDHQLLEIDLEPLTDHSVWMMNLKAEKWRLRWQAKLLDFEVAWLQEHPATAARMARLVKAS